VNSRERVLKALNHQEPDRVPFDLGGTTVTGMNINSYRALREYLGLKKLEPELRNVAGQIARVDDDLADRLKVDVKFVSPNRPGGFNWKYEEIGEYICMYDEFKIGRRMPKAGGMYFDMFENPLAGDITEENVDRFPWPDSLDPARFEGMKERAVYIAEKEERAVAVNDHITGILEVY
jgi:uroporphyrinogen decarboxylase